MISGGSLLMPQQRIAERSKLLKAQTPLTGKRSKPQPMNPDLKAQMALARYANFGTTGSLTSIKQLQNQFHRAPAVISRAIKSALSEGLVEVHAKLSGMDGPEPDDPKLCYIGDAL